MLGIRSALRTTATIVLSGGVGAGASFLGADPWTILVAGGITGGITQLMSSIKDLKNFLKGPSTFELAVFAGAGAATAGSLLIP